MSSYDELQCIIKTFWGKASEKKKSSTKALSQSDALKKKYKKLKSEFPAPVAPKLRLGIVVNLGGRLSHKFAIFAKKFCIELLNALH